MSQQASNENVNTGANIPRGPHSRFSNAYVPANYDPQNGLNVYGNNWNYGIWGNPFGFPFYTQCWYCVHTGFH